MWGRVRFEGQMDVSSDRHPFQNVWFSSASPTTKRGAIAIAQGESTLRLIDK